MTWLADRRRLQERVEALRPWYQPIRLPGLVFTRPINRETVAQWVRCERGFRKFDHFLKPILPVSLRGARVLEIGCNAGQGLVWAVGQGAVECVGVEKYDRYFHQAELVVKTLGLTDKIGIIHDDISGVSIPSDAFDYEQWTYVWCLNVIYHLPADSRVPVLRWMAEVSDYVVLQGNGLQDCGGGRGYHSLMALIREAGLTVQACHREAHVRGLVVVVKS